MSKTRVVLVLSLGLNLLVLGAVLGHAWRGGFDRGPPPLAWGLRTLSPEARAQVMPRLRENLQESRAQRRALRQAGEAVEAAVGREPFDRPGLTEALAELRGATNAYQQQMHERALDVLAELSPYVDADGTASTRYNGNPRVGVALETNLDNSEKLVECILKL